MNLSIHIERLILDGLTLTSNQRRLVQAAVEMELSQLLAAGGLSPELSAGGARPSIRAGDIQLTNDTHPARLGRQIARAVYGGIGATEWTRSQQDKDRGI